MNSIDKLKLSDIASTLVFTIAPDNLVDDAITLMAERKVSALLVLEANRPVGIVTERDVLRLMHQGVAAGCRVREVMSSPVLTAAPELDFRAGHLLLEQHGLRHLVLVGSGGEVAGMVTETDFRTHLGQDVFRRIQNLSTVMDCRNSLLGPEASLAEAVARMVEAKLDHVIVAREGRALGILTERDMPRLLARHVDPHGVPVGTVMSSPVLSIPLQSSVAEAARRMAETHTRHMVVTDEENRMMGVVSQHHLLERLSVLLMEENQSQMESRLDLMLETTGVGIWEYDHRTDRLNRSPALRAMSGYGDEQADANMNAWLEQIHPDDLAGVKARFEAALVGEAPLFETEYRTRNRDGQWQWISVRGRVVERDERGHPARSAGIAVDVSAAKAVQRELEEERGRLGTLLRTIPDLVWVKDPEGVYLECNPAFERLYGTPKAGIVGRRDEDFVSLELAEFFRSHDRAAAAAGKPTINEEWLTFAADGYRGLFETIKTPMRDGDGKLIGVLGVARDITAMRYVEASLREREEIHSAILSQALDAIGLLDVETLRFVEFNEAAHGNLGYTKEAFARLELKDMEAVLSPEETRRAVDKLCRAGKGVFETRHRRQDGEIRDARISARLVSLHGREYLACIWSDITEHKLKETQLREQVEELRRWQDATLGRESRILELKHEVNELLARSGQPPRYASAEEAPGGEP